MAYAISIVTFSWLFLNLYIYIDTYRYIFMWSMYPLPLGEADTGQWPLGIWRPRARAVPSRSSPRGLRAGLVFFHCLLLPSVFFLQDFNILILPPSPPKKKSTEGKISRLRVPLKNAPTSGGSLFFIISASKCKSAVALPSLFRALIWKRRLPGAVRLPPRSAGLSLRRAARRGVAGPPAQRAGVPVPQCRDVTPKGKGEDTAAGSGGDKRWGELRMRSFSFGLGFRGFLKCNMGNCLILEAGQSKGGK